MIIVTDCLSEVLDEGCLKVTNSLIKRIKSKVADTTVVSYGNNRNGLSDLHLKLNKLFLNLSLYKVLSKSDEEVLYIPLSSYTIASLIRTIVLTLISKKVSVLFVGWSPINKVKNFLFKLLKCRIYVLTKETEDYLSFYTKSQIIQLKAGVDTKRFIPVSSERKNELRKKYGFNIEDKIVLHVGHMKKGRGVETMLELNENYTPLLVVSTSTSQEEDTKKCLRSRENFRIMDTYIPNIEEIYQFSDLYFFPVVEKENCIDIPLSAFEAAACGLPVVATKYGELNAFVNKKGFYFLNEVEGDTINKYIETALSESDGQVCEYIYEYDWDNAISQLLKGKA